MTPRRCAGILEVYRIWAKLSDVSAVPSWAEEPLSRNAAIRAPRGGGARLSEAHRRKRRALPASYLKKSAAPNFGRKATLYEAGRAKRRARRAKSCEIARLHGGMADGARALCALALLTERGVQWGGCGARPPTLGLTTKCERETRKRTSVR